MEIAPGAEGATQNVSNQHNHSSKDLFDFKQLHFPKFKHESHPVVQNVNEETEGHMTRGQQIADAVAATVGSWRFIIIQSTILLIWLILNSIGWALKWDPYPFILLNLALSFQAAYSAPFVMMSQNRQAEKDRLTAQNDYLTDCKGEEEIRHIMNHLDHQDTVILQLLHRLEEQHNEMKAHLSKLSPELAQQLITEIKQEK